MQETISGPSEADRNFRFEEESTGSEPQANGEEAEKLTAEKYKELKTENNPTFNPDEFEFHQKRFKKRAEEWKEKQEKSLLHKVLYADEKMTEVDFAHEEALKDNAEFDRLMEEGNRKELKEWERLNSIVREHMKEVRDDPEGKGKDRHILLLAMGGGMLGSGGAGQVAAFRKLDYAKVFKTAVGISAGACDVGYMLGGDDNVMKGVSMYYEDCAGPEFISYKLQRLPQVMDVNFLSERMANGPKALNVDNIRQSPTEFFVQATNAKTNQPEILNAKKDPVKYINASMNLPLVGGKGPVQLEEGAYIDGFFEPLPLEKVIEKFHPTDIVILPNMPFRGMDSFKTSKGELWLAQLMPRQGSLGLVEKVLRQKQRLRETFELMKEKGVNVACFWPPDEGVTKVTKDPDKLEANIRAAANKICEEFGEPEKAKEINYFHTSV